MHVRDLCTSIRENIILCTGVTYSTQEAYILNVCVWGGGGGLGRGRTVNIPISTEGNGKKCFLFMVIWRQTNFIYGYMASDIW